MPLETLDPSALLLADCDSGDTTETEALAAAMEDWGGAALVTSLTALGAPCERVLFVGGLEAPGKSSAAPGHPAFQLWLDHARRLRGDSFDLNPDEAGELCLLLEAVGGLPAAVVASATLHSVLSLQEQLRRLGTREDPIGKRLARIFQPAWKQLSVPQQRLVAVTAAAANALPPEAAGGSYADVLEDVLCLQQRGLMRRNVMASLALAPPFEFAVEHLATESVLAHASAQLGEWLRQTRSLEHDARWKTTAHVLPRIGDSRLRLELALECSGALSPGEFPEIWAALMEDSDGLEPELATRVWLARVEAHQRAGQGLKAERALEAAVLESNALPLASSPRVHALLLQLRNQLVPTGDLETARQTLQSLLADVGLSEDLRFEVTLALSDIGTKLGDPDLAVDSAEHALHIALSTQDGTGIALAFTQMAATFVQLGDAEGALSYARRAVESAADAEERVQLEAGLVLATAHNCAGDFALARRKYSQLMVTAETLGEHAVHARCIAYKGLASALSGDFATSRVELDEGASRLETAGDQRYAAFARALLGVLHARQGHVELGSSLVDRAERTLEPTGDALLLAAVRLCKARVALTASGDGRGPEREELACMLEALRDRAAETRSPTARSVELRRLAAFMEAEVLGSNAELGSLHLGPDARWIQLNAEPRVELERRPTARRLLACLADANERAPGTVVDNEQLIAAAWPEQRVLNESAINRLRVTVFRLRQMGLAEYLRADAAGYLLVPGLKILRDG